MSFHRHDPLLRTTLASTPNTRSIQIRGARGFGLVETLVSLSVMAIVSSIAISSVINLLEQQRLRQAAIELISYLHTARGRAMREANLAGRPCEILLVSTNTELIPSNSTSNSCNDTPGLAALNLRASSQVQGLTITSNLGNLTNYVLTFTRFGTLAAETISGTPANPYPLIFYLGSSRTSMQRCVWVDAALIRSGWRNSPSATRCTYNEF